MLDILQWIFYGKPFSVMILACNCPFSFPTSLTATSTPGLSLPSLALPSPGYHFYQQHPHTLQVLHFYPVLVDIATTEAQAWQAVRGWVWLTAGCVCLHTGMCVFVWVCACRNQVGTAGRGIILQKPAAGAGMLSGLWNTPMLLVCPLGSSVSLVIPGSRRSHKASVVISR